MSHCHRDIHNVTFFFCPIIHHCVSVQEREKSISFDKNNRAIKRPNWVQVGYYRFYKIHLKNKISKIMVWFGSYSSDRQRDVYTSDSRLMTIWRVTRIRNKCKSTFRWRRAWKKKGGGGKRERDEWKTSAIRDIWFTYLRLLWATPRQKCAQVSLASTQKNERKNGKRDWLTRGYRW